MKLVALEALYKKGILKQLSAYLCVYTKHHTYIYCSCVFVASFIYRYYGIL